MVTGILHPHHNMAGSSCVDANLRCDSWCLETSRARVPSTGKQGHSLPVNLRDFLGLQDKATSLSRAMSNLLAIATKASNRWFWHSLFGDPLCRFRAAAPHAAGGLPSLRHPDLLGVLTSRFLSCTIAAILLCFKLPPGNSIILAHLEVSLGLQRIWGRCKQSPVQLWEVLLPPGRDLDL